MCARARLCALVGKRAVQHAHRRVCPGQDPGARAGAETDRRPRESCAGDTVSCYSLVAATLSSCKYLFAVPHQEQRLTKRVLRRRYCYCHNSCGSLVVPVTFHGLCSLVVPVSFHGLYSLVVPVSNGLYSLVVSVSFSRRQDPRARARRQRPRAAPARARGSVRSPTDGVVGPPRTTRTIRVAGRDTDAGPAGPIPSTPPKPSRVAW